MPIVRNALFALLTIPLFLVTPSIGADISPAVIYSTGGKFDGSFNQAAYDGAERYKALTGTDYAEFEIQNDTQSEQALRRFADRGRNPIVAIGFNHAAALAKVAKEFPDVKFTIIDMFVDAPNVRSVVFREHEGAYVVGVLAAMASNSGKIGFIGGMDIPLIRKFACGYKQGALAVDGEIEVMQSMTGTTFTAWSDPTRGGELAKSQIDAGADVILHGAGTTGLGVLQMAADEGILGIGVDSNQNHLHPGNMLTSMLKRVDVAVEQTFADTASGTWSAGIRSLGLKEEGLGWALDEHNRSLISAEMEQAADDAAAAIINGSIKVHDYTSDDNCPF